MKKALALIAFISILVNIFIIIFYVKHVKNGLSSGGVSENNTQLSFLSKRIFIEDQNDIIVNMTDLRNKINTYANGVGPKFGLYFEYLPSGVSIGVNDKEQFVWASLLKVPLAMAVYKQIEKGQLSFEDVLTIKETNINKNFGDLWKKGVGTKITIKEAVQLMLIESDNTAKSVLYDVLPSSAIEDVFDYLDIPKVLDNNESTPVVTAKNYSSILRSLYLSSYLDKKYSNELLQLLTLTPFDDKLRAGVPKDVKVAHKIGVHVAGVGKNEDSLSIYTDCGIVYYPKRPYIVCLMIQSTESEARIRMRDISSLIYTYISEINK